MKNPIQQKNDIDILESAVRLLTRALNDLTANCYDNSGKLKAPDKKIVIKAQSYLPSGYSMSLIKTK